MAPVTVGALYVVPDGVYSEVPGVELWGLPELDAREYAGSHPVVAHPPCERWGRYWSGGPSASYRRELGDDGGCFEAALAAVREWGGVLEHPEASHAWRWFGLERPPRAGGWIQADDQGGWTCCVEQGHYGHPARKATWLYALDADLPELVWGPSPSGIRLDAGYHSTEERRRHAGKVRPVQRLSKRQRAETPRPFRDLLIAMARSAALPREGT